MKIRNKYFTNCLNLYKKNKRQRTNKQRMDIKKKIKRNTHSYKQT